MHQGLHEFLYHRWLGSFLPVEATVAGTRIDDVERGELGGYIGLAPRVLYDFRVDGKAYRGYKIHWELHLPAPVELGGGPPPPDSVMWDRERSESTRKALQKILQTYPVGKTVTAYYDPADPANACLVFVPYVWYLHGSGLWFVLGVLLVLWTIFAVAWRVAVRKAKPAPSSAPG
jgi:hypothetical protein